MDDRQRSDGQTVTTVLGRIIIFILDSMFDQYLWTLWTKVRRKMVKCEEVQSRADTREKVNERTVDKYCKEKC